MLRRGEEPKLSPEDEAALLEKLRYEREAKAVATMHAEVQQLSAKMVHIDLADIKDEAKKLVSTEKALAFAKDDAMVAIVLNAVMRSCAPPPADDEKKGKGGKNKKGPGSIKPTKVVEGVPPTGAEVRKALKANKAIIADALKGKSGGQLALLKALQSWVLSAQGENARPATAKIIEVLYDIDLAEEEALTKYWANLQTQRTREAAELEQVGTVVE